MCVRPSTGFYSRFSLGMGRSPGFGPARADSCALLRLAFAAAPRLCRLTSPAPAARRTVLQKVRGRTFDVLPQLVNTGFQVLFHSPPGVLFTFPSQYYALSVTGEYLAFGVVPARSHRVSRVPWYSGSCRVPFVFTYRAFTVSGRSFQDRSANNRESLMQSEPRHARIPVWALSLSLAATLEIENFLSFPPAT